MLKKIKMSYLVSGVLFLAIAYLGGVYLSWRMEAFAFLLMTYLIIVIGIRLDEISGRLMEIQEQLAQIKEHRLHK
jgi:uncharacterized membrane protein